MKLQVGDFPLSIRSVFYAPPLFGSLSFLLIVFVIYGVTVHQEIGSTKKKCVKSDPSTTIGKCGVLAA